MGDPQTDPGYLDHAIERVNSGWRVTFLANSAYPWCVYCRDDLGWRGTCHPTPEAALIAYKALVFDQLFPA